eukprot:CAMPEP_0172523712 /NCGR_PEP_ID=MMETSP1066-20121228/293806_1 /TAXON_ID=671091 /ORGANISM="Coscinodiscus wailesii, Strain CCMP2513" /LENGTH=449 /DNA_ID=CAMNT_0013306799 /DNA_START=183 /DNA_END=1529 /DNA_ORIENTATION=+
MPPKANSSAATTTNAADAVTSSTPLLDDDDDDMTTLLSRDITKLIESYTYHLRTELTRSQSQLRKVTTELSDERRKRRDLEKRVATWYSRIKRWMAKGHHREKGEEGGGGRGASLLPPPPPTADCDVVESSEAPYHSLPFEEVRGTTTVSAPPSSRSKKRKLNATSTTTPEKPSDVRSIVASAARSISSSCSSRENGLSLDSSTSTLTTPPSQSSVGSGNGTATTTTCHRSESDIVKECPRIKDDSRAEGRRRPRRRADTEREDDTTARMKREETKRDCDDGTQPRSDNDGRVVDNRRIKQEEPEHTVPFHSQPLLSMVEQRHEQPPLQPHPNNVTNQMPPPPPVKSDPDPPPPPPPPHPPRRNPYRYQQTIRQKSIRRTLPGHTCPNCDAFVNALCAGSNPAITDRGEFLKHCSRHKCHYSPEATPEGFWELSFADSIRERKKGEEER